MLLLIVGNAAPITATADLKESAVDPFRYLPVATSTLDPATAEVEPVVAEPVPELPQLQMVDVAITFYICPPFCGRMASGRVVYDGAAACGYAFELGQRFTLAGKQYTCEDRGMGPAYWVDIWWAGSLEGGYEWRAGLNTTQIGIIPERR